MVNSFYILIIVEFFEGHWVDTHVESLRLAPLHELFTSGKHAVLVGDLLLHVDIFLNLFILILGDFDLFDVLFFGLLHNLLLLTFLLVQLDGFRQLAFRFFLRISRFNYRLRRRLNLGRRLWLSLFFHFFLLFFLLGCRRFSPVV